MAEDKKLREAYNRGLLEATEYIMNALKNAARDLRIEIVADAADEAFLRERDELKGEDRG